jgi:methyl-accepting chemotaxis protein PixJ
MENPNNSQFQESNPTDNDNDLVTPIPKIDVSAEIPVISPKKRSLWRKMNLRNKAALLAVALGTIPVMILGTISYEFAREALNKQVLENQVSDVNYLQNEIASFLYERLGDIQIMADLDILTKEELLKSSSLQEKAETLAKFEKAYSFYDSIAFYDLEGNLIVKTAGVAIGNQKNRPYFQKALSSSGAIVSEIDKSDSTGIYNFYVATKVIDRASGEPIGIIRARIPIISLQKTIKLHNKKEQKFVYFISNSGEVFLKSDDLVAKTPTNNNSVLKLADIFPSLAKNTQSDRLVTTIVKNQLTKTEQVIAYAPPLKQSNLPDIQWSAIVAQNNNIAFAGQVQLQTTLILGTLVTAALVGLAGVAIANRLVRPLLASAEGVQLLGQGFFDNRLEVRGDDEISSLNQSINAMAAQIQTLLIDKETSAQKEMAVQTEIARQQKSSNEGLQRELFQFLNEIEGAASGDLTVRSQITDGEIGIVADFFNSIVESLRDIVTQVKSAAVKVKDSVSDNEGAIRGLAQEAIRQTDRVNDTLNSVEVMAQSIQDVADNAQSAAEIARIASANACEGGESIKRTVESILRLRETIAETAKKVKRLGESSQQISKVVGLIDRIAMQTNLLAINASIEAARAGEEGRGFAVVAEEVGELATQSAAATKEIEEIVETIQQETADVVEAMELGTTQVVEGTRLVEETKNSLFEILLVSQKIDEIVQHISSTTVSQTQTSESVKQLIQEIAHISEHTSTSSVKVSSALQETLAITQELQQSMKAFKVIN